MKTTICVLLILSPPGLAVAAPAPAVAPAVGGAVPATDATVARLIAQSLAALPELSQARAVARAQRERVPQAGALPDPVLQLGIQNDGFRRIEIGRMETSYISIMASQTFPWFGKRQLRGEIAELGAQQSERSIDRVRLSTEADVRRAYLDLVFARDRLRLLDRLEAIWQKSAAIARVRYESGQGSQADLLRSQLEQSRLRQRRWLLQADVQTRVQGLNRLRRRPLAEPIPTTSTLRDLGVPRVPDERLAIEDAFARSPELAAARLGLVEAGKSVALARKSYLPDFTVSAGIMPRGGDFPPMWQLGVGGTLPIFAGRKQSRAVAESRSRVVASESNVEALEQVLRLRVQQRRTILATVRETIRLYREGLLVQSATTAESTLTQYHVGRASFASVLEANAGTIGDEDSYLQALADAQRVAIALVEVSLDPVAGAPSGGGMGAAAMPGIGAASAGASSTGAAAGALTPAGEGRSSMSGM